MATRTYKLLINVEAPDDPSEGQLMDIIDQIDRSLTHPFTSYKVEVTDLHDITDGNFEADIV